LNARTARRLLAGIGIAKRAKPGNQLQEGASMSDCTITGPYRLPKAGLQRLLDLLHADGFETIGPKIEQGAIVYTAIRATAELPIGWADLQSPGAYRLEKRKDEAWFGFAVGPHSWKKHLFPPTLTLFRVRRGENGFDVIDGAPEPPLRALIGVRSCELHAIGVQDRTFLQHGARHADPYYAAARQRLLVVAVECEHPAGTCFCASMGTGPAIIPERIPLPLAPAANGGAPPPRPAVDLVLTELDDAFVVRPESDAGRKLIARLRLEPATSEQVDEGRSRVAGAALKMGRTLEANGLQELLHGNQESPRWKEVAQRCLACTNCTLVCPTCFCSGVQDVADLGMENAERVRRWDSCFDPDFAQVHGGNFRTSVEARYRQWLTHKFASWHDQFDVSGCVGCGRCITWCPVGIDVTEELAVIRRDAADG
jgi:sulfhydrogenase subunit beta (sulfur reductase)